MSVFSTKVHKHTRSVARSTRQVHPYTKSPLGDFVERQLKAAATFTHNLASCARADQVRPEQAGPGL